MSGEIFILVEGYNSELQIIESLKTCFDIKLKSKVIRVEHLVLVSIVFIKRSVMIQI